MIWIIGLGVVGLIGGCIWVAIRARKKILRYNFREPGFYLYILASILIGIGIGCLIATFISLRAPAELYLIEKSENIVWDAPYIYYTQKVEDKCGGSILKAIRVPVSTRGNLRFRFYEHERMDSTLEIWEKRREGGWLWGGGTVTYPTKIYKIYIPKGALGELLEK